MIGKFCLSNFADFEKVADRFIHTENVERALKYPKIFEQFSDLSYDHFSMFQFYDGNEEMIINYNFAAISLFFSEELLVDVPIFHTDNLFFYLNNTSLTAICNGQRIVVDITPIFSKKLSKLLYLKNNITSAFSNADIYNIFQNCKPILLILYANDIITIDISINI